MVPQEAMHVEGGGIIVKEAKDMIHEHIQVKKLYTLDQANAVWRRLKRQHPILRPIPDFHPRVLKKKTKALRIKAHDAHTFMRYSLKLFRELLGSESNDPSWRAWQTHFKYFELLFQESLTQQDVSKLEKLIYKHHRQLKRIQGNRKIPKHHFATHMPGDVLRAGPARWRWLFALEGYNKRINEWARHSKYKNVLKHVAVYNSLQTGYELLYE